MTVRLALVDDHPLLAAGLRGELERNDADVRLLDPAMGAEAIVELISLAEVSAAVVDLGLPFPGGGQTLIPPLVERRIPVVVLTGETERAQWAMAIHRGASVVVSKAEPLADIVEIVLRVAAGETVRTVEREELKAEHHRIEAERRGQLGVFQALSHREAEILAGLMEGWSVGQLADQHIVSVQTVRSQVKSLLRKIGCSSQLEAVALAHSVGWRVPAVASGLAEPEPGQG